MEIKKLQFKSADAQKIYENYLKQIQIVTKKLSAEDQLDIVMELNSHIYESISKKTDSENEVSNLLNTLDNIGIPSEILKPLIAEKKLKQATKTFSPIHLFQALVLNFSYGIIYIVFFVLYLLLFSFSLLILGEIFFPKNFGLYYKAGEFFQFGGFVDNNYIQQYEILGNWFIPATILIVVFFYLLIILLLKLKKLLKKETSKKLNKS